MVIDGALYVARRESLRERDNFRFGFGMTSLFCDKALYSALSDF
jgi:hypothetical protein